MNGQSPNEGTIEVRQNNETWKSYYGVFLTGREVVVICRQLGYPGTHSFFDLTPYNFSSIFVDTFYICDTGGKLNIKKKPERSSYYRKFICTDNIYNNNNTIIIRFLS